MDILFSRMFWGGIIVIIGLSIIIGVVFKVHIPLFRIIMALLLIYFGITMLMGSFRGQRNKEAGKANDVFGNSNIKADPASLNNEYNVVFGSQVIDLTSITDGADRTIELNAVFGSQTVYVNPATKIRIKASAVFGQVSLPDNSTVNFGDHTYQQSPMDTLSAGTLYIEASAVFGNIKILKEKRPN